MLNRTQCSAEVQEREITEIKSMKRPNAMQRGSVRKRIQRKKVDEEPQRNATQRGCGRKRNQRNKVNEEA